MREVYMSRWMWGQRREEDLSRNSATELRVRLGHWIWKKGGRGEESFLCKNYGTFSFRPVVCNITKCITISRVAKETTIVQVKTNGCVVFICFLL